MKSQVFLAIVLVVLARGDEWNLIHFVQNSFKTLRCLEQNTLLLNLIPRNSTRNIVLWSLSYEFSSTTVPAESINLTLTEIINDLIINNELRINQTYQLKVALADALLLCSGEDSFTSSHEYSYESEFSNDEFASDEESENEGEVDSEDEVDNKVKKNHLPNNEIITTDGLRSGELLGSKDELRIKNKNYRATSSGLSRNEELCIKNTKDEKGLTSNSNEHGTNNSNNYSFSSEKPTTEKNEEKKLDIESSHQLNHFNLPHFVQETPEFTDLLNFMLVDNQMDLRTVIIFARNALLVLESSFTRARSSQRLYFELHDMWERRSELFFDFANEVPYIRHTYSVDRPTPYTCDDPSLFNARRRLNLNERNTQISKENNLRLHNFHRADWDSRNRRYFYFTFYRIRYPTESVYYYEILENQFFRILFFYLELVERGIIGLNQDPNVLSYGDIPEELLWLLCSIQDDGMSYSQYLGNVYKKELNYSKKRVITVKDRTDEIRLVLAFWNRLKSQINHISTTTSSTTIFITESTTSGYEESKRGKGLVTRLPSGKCISKQGFNDDGNVRSSDSSCQIKSKHSQRSKESMDFEQDKFLLNSLQEILSNTLDSKLCFRKR